ncbi:MULTISPECIES: DASS family sodium-coupled anion symporter [Brevibacterium]|uniref:Sodium-dependent dicarboxylate transporter SdcS n=1 Tax=Brevibacterium pityocampae TaxID=506594 RepID=A0ABP8JI18_9MICO|nr:DASS family sodium-coupled anion symporter [Brevibacterium sp. CS2]QCP05401.1 DASS family sodium-coupled anion symporter [Brevibacterium sp. CS2]
MSSTRPAGEHAARYAPLPQGDTEREFKSPGERAEGFSLGTTRIRWIGFVGGLLAAVLLWVIMPDDLPQAARVTAAAAGLMAVWWMTEAIPIPATALVPLVVFPLLGGTEEEPATVSSVGASYGSDTIFLFMGGFLIALAMQRWNLHRRIALFVLSLMGESTGAMIAGFMIATGFLSMWVSNTATAVLMLPIGLSVLVLVNEAMEKDSDSESLAEVSEADEADGDSEAAVDSPGGESVRSSVLRSNFGTALMLGIAYAASVGSLGTIIGTPPNLLLVGYLQENHDITIGFGQWMLVGVPLSLVMMAITWFLLVKVLFKPETDRIPGGRDLIAAEKEKLGAMSLGEKLVLAIFVLAAASWITIPLVFEEPPISDAGIAIVVGILLFIVPAGAERGVRLLDWESAVELPWGVLLLFGGGLALSAQFSSSGLTDWIGESAQGLAGVPVLVLVLILAAGILLLTEITSNTATAATFLPVVGGVAVGLEIDPLLLTIPVALAATCAFMLPVATPPNAVAYGSGYVTIAQMVKGGVLLNLVGVVLITLVTMTLATWVFGIAY